MTGTKSEEWYFSRIAERHSDVFFLQVGANDGVTEDHIHPIVRRCGWRGLLLEPMKTSYERLVENYAGAAGLLFDNRALAELDGTRTFYRLHDPDGGLPKWCAGIGSFSREVVLMHQVELPDVEKYIFEETVECVSFHTLIADHDIDRIDVVVIDTEGYDLEVLRQFDFDRFRPELIFYEQVILSEEQKRQAVQLLEKHGYDVHRIGPNNAAVLR